jgi:GxxExxY protein
LPISCDSTAKCLVPQQFDAGCGAVIAYDPRVNEITGDIIRLFFQTYNALGHGYLESHYARALEYELREAGHDVAREFGVQVYYRDIELGFHRLDMVVDHTVVVELKATAVLAPFARRQLYNYLRATNLEVGLLLHYGPSPRFQRIIVPNPGVRGAIAG